jgi:hypothetical protein
MKKAKSSEDSSKIDKKKEKSYDCYKVKGRISSFEIRLKVYYKKVLSKKFYDAFYPYYS